MPSGPPWPADHDCFADRSIVSCDRWLKGGNEPGLRGLGTETLYRLAYRARQKVQKLGRLLSGQSPTRPVETPRDEEHDHRSRPSSKALARSSKTACLIVSSLRLAPDSIWPSAAAWPLLAGAQPRRQSRAGYRNPPRRGQRRQGPLFRRLQLCRQGLDGRVPCHRPLRGYRAATAASRRGLLTASPISPAHSVGAMKFSTAAAVRPNPSSRRTSYTSSPTARPAPRPLQTQTSQIKIARKASPSRMPQRRPPRGLLNEAG